MFHTFGTLKAVLGIKEILKALVYIGSGISLHDFAHQVYELKGEYLSLEGGYIGFIITIASFILLNYIEVIGGRE